MWEQDVKVCIDLALTHLVRESPLYKLLVCNLGTAYGYMICNESLVFFSSNVCFPAGISNHSRVLMVTLTENLKAVSGVAIPLADL